MGGFMGLLLGASVITLCEVLDLLIFNSLIRCNRRNRVLDYSGEDKILPSASGVSPPPSQESSQTRIINLTEDNK